MPSFTIDATGSYGPVRSSSNIIWDLNALGAGDTVEVRVSGDGGNTQTVLQDVTAATPTMNGQIANNGADFEFYFNCTVYSGTPFTGIVQI